MRARVSSTGSSSPRGSCSSETPSAADSRAFGTTSSFRRRAPSTRHVLPTVEQIRDAFEARGFATEALDTFEQEIDPSLAAHYDRLKRRALSSFELMTDADFEHGLARLRIAASLETTPTPILEKIDLLVLRRPTANRASTTGAATPPST
jgi:hypothetical protein